MNDLIEGDPDRAAAAALLRRSSLAPTTERIDELAGYSWDDMVDRVLDLAVLQEAVETPIPSTDDRDDLVAWWIERMGQPDSGIVDRMTWIWHGILTTNARSVGNVELIRRQMTLLRSQSIGNYRDLLHEFVVDGALLRYLDGDGSAAHNPNENLGRELMELFTIGRGNYTQDDVRAAARALAGWQVDDEDEAGPSVGFDRSHSFVAPLVFLGDQRNWDTEMLVDRLCDHPATAVTIASQIWFELIGTELTAGDAADLGRWWQDAELEILPLIERIIRSERARTARYTRARSGLEWYVAASAVAGFPLDSIWTLRDLGQMPYDPPNVAGWPSGDRWLQPGALARRAVLMGSASFERAPGRTTDEVLRACGIETVSATTRRALELAGDADALQPDEQAALRWRLALNAPEFHLS